MIDTAITLASVPAVLALVNLLKSFGVRGKCSALASVLIAMGIVAAEAWAPSGIYDVLSRGAVLGLAAAGLYDVADQMGATQSVNVERGTVVEMNTEPAQRARHRARAPWLIQPSREASVGR